MGTADKSTNADLSRLSEPGKSFKSKSVAHSARARLTRAVVIALGGTALPLAVSAGSRWSLQEHFEEGQTACNCDNVDGTVGILSADFSVINGAAVTGAHVGVLYNGSQPTLCFGPQVPYTAVIQHLYERVNDPSVSGIANPMLTIEVWADPDVGGSASQLNPLDPSWWWDMTGSVVPQTPKLLAWVPGVQQPEEFEINWGDSDPLPTASGGDAVGNNLNGTSWPTSTGGSPLPGSMLGQSVVIPPLSAFEAKWEIHCLGGSSDGDNCVADGEYVKVIAQLSTKLSAAD